MVYCFNVFYVRSLWGVSLEWLRNWFIYSQKWNEYKEKLIKTTGSKKKSLRLRTVWTLNEIPFSKLCMSLIFWLTQYWKDGRLVPFFFKFAHSTALKKIRSQIFLFLIKESFLTLAEDRESFQGIFLIIF